MVDGGDEVEAELGVVVWVWRWLIGMRDWFGVGEGE